MTSNSEFEKTEAHILTRQLVYNFWISLTRGEWQRAAVERRKLLYLNIILALLLSITMLIQL
ncbi:hypothetical protein V1527DRAFT_459531 [Lipomyces starkeyi]